MGIVIPAGFAQASFGGTVAGDAEQMFITLGLDLSAPADQAMANDLYDAWTDALQGDTSSDFTFEICQLKEGPTATGPTFDSAGPPLPGAVGVAMVPCNTALLVRKNTALGGRKGRGRMYSVGQVMVDNIGGAGILSPTVVATLDADFFSFLGAVQGVTGVSGAVLLHSDATTPTPILGLNPQSRVATQRRRLRP